MLTRALLLSLLFTRLALAATPVPEGQVRSVWKPAREQPIEIFIDARPASAPTSVSLPAALKHFEADPGAQVLPFLGDTTRIQLNTLQGLQRGATLKVRVTLADDSRLLLHLVARPSTRDLLVNIRERPTVPPEEQARALRKRLMTCQSPQALIAAKAKLIAAHGAEAVLHREEGLIAVSKQTNRLTLSFVDVVHDAGISYATLQVYNRSKEEWPIDLDQFSLTSPQGTEVPILSKASEFPKARAGRSTRVVLAYETPGSSETLVALVREAGMPLLVVQVIP